MRARRLRRDATDVEAKLWSKLRGGQIGGHSFRRQHPAGPYVLDFYCPALGLAVELDGGQHGGPKHAMRDRRRDEWFRQHGVQVIRFWNSDVTGNMPGVLEQINAAAEERAVSKKTPTGRWRADLPLSGGG